MPNPAKALRLTRLRLTNWRNFRQVDVRLRDRNFIVGPNGSGKSNLLDAIRFLADLVKPSGGGLQAALDARQGFRAIRCLHRTGVTQFVEIEASVGNDEQPDLWEYTLRFDMPGHETLASIVRERVTKRGAKVIERNRQPNDERRRFSQTYIEQAEQAQGARELTDFFGSIRYLHVVPQIVRDRQRAKPEGDDPFGGDLLRRMKQMPKKSRLPRLRRIQQALTIAVPQFAGLELEDDIDGVPHLIASFQHWRNKATKQNEVFFSDGTLRLVGLLWSVAEGGGPLLLEEPELSLNDAVVETLPAMMHKMQQLSGRQVFVTTHSSALLDDENIGLREVHRVIVDNQGSRAETLADDPVIVAQVENGLSVGDAVLPLLRPDRIEEFADRAADA
jgi:predicted ATPase